MDYWYHIPTKQTTYFCRHFWNTHSRIVRSSYIGNNQGINRRIRAAKYSKYMTDKVLKILFHTKSMKNKEIDTEINKIKTNTILPISLGLSSTSNISTNINSPSSMIIKDKNNEYTEKERGLSETEIACARACRLLDLSAIPERLPCREGKISSLYLLS